MTVNHSMKHHRCQECGCGESRRHDISHEAMYRITELCAD
jgi:hypothetical protein